METLTMKGIPWSGLRSVPSRRSLSSLSAMLMVYDNVAMEMTAAKSAIVVEHLFVMMSNQFDTSKLFFDQQLL